MATRMTKQLRSLKQIYPWVSSPIIVSAPMRVFSGPALASAVSLAGGIGFIGPGAKPSELESTLEETRRLLRLPSDSSIPIGVGFQTFDADLSIASSALKKHRPAAVWLFAPRNGQDELDLWIERIKEASPESQIWIQVGSVIDAMKAVQAKSPPDVLVVQGNDAGGHGLERGAGVISLVPEVIDAIKHTKIPVFAAGGISDGRGVAGVLSLGTVGAVMGTRFLASKEAKIPKGYQRDILRIQDGGQTTVRTKLYDHMAGRTDWPSMYDGRNIINQTYLDHASGLKAAENKQLYQEALKLGDEGWGIKGRLTAYVGSGVGLIHEVMGAADIVRGTREESLDVIRAMNGFI